MSDVVREILATAGLDIDQVRITSLSGGVSCETSAVEYPGEDSGPSLVVKQALPKLKVAEDWRADPSRVVAEGAALTWFHQQTPEHVPNPIAVVPGLYGLILPMAPQPCPDWRTRMLTAPQASDPAIAAVLAGIAATWHGADIDDARGSVLDETSRLVTLRVDPFYRDMARRWPEFASVINTQVQELLDIRIAMVHGDFTPKNVLCLPNNVWVVDAEVAHIGNPVLDTASMMAHLLLKSLHVQGQPDASAIMAQTRLAFRDGLSGSAVSTPTSLPTHIGTIMGVRVAGRSPVGYLSEDSRNAGELMARALLNGASLDEVERTWLM